MKRKDFPHAVNAGTAKEEENDGTAMDEENDTTDMEEENDGTALDEKSDTTDMDEKNNGTAEKGDKTGDYGRFTAILLTITNAAINFFKTWIWKSDDVKQKVVPEKNATKPCDKIEQCNKNPGHEKFIRVSHFDIEKDLPEGYQDKIYDLYIRSVIGLTVHTRYYFWRVYSNDTPKKKLELFSGMLFKVDKRFDTVERLDTVDETTCPCKRCDGPPSNYGRYMMRTAEHVMPTYVQSLKDMTVYLDYDNGKQLSSCDKLYVSQIKEIEPDQDCCIVLCVSHDKTLCEEIEKRLEQYDSHYDKLVKETKNKRRGVKNLPVICVSHPHGNSKRISIGKMLCVKKGQPDAWKYTTPTCIGCSGAPVFILEEKMQGEEPYHISVHTWGDTLCNENESGNWTGKKRPRKPQLPLEG